MSKEQFSLTQKPDLSFERDGKTYLIISEEQSSKLDKLMENVTNFMKENSDGKDLSDEEKLQLFAQAQNLWNEYANELKDTKFFMRMTPDVSKYVAQLLNDKIEYDVNSVFFAIEIADRIKDLRKLKDEDHTLELNTTEITYFYHLLSSHKVKGLTKDTYAFVDFLLRIGEISKVINYYNTWAEHLQSDIHIWTSTMDDPNVTLDKSVDRSKPTPEVPQEVMSESMSQD